MTTEQLIESRNSEFQNIDLVSLGDDGNMYVRRPNVEAFFSESIRLGVQLGLEMAKESVPGEVTGDAFSAYVRDAEAEGWNDCRETTLSNIEDLQKSV